MPQQERWVLYADPRIDVDQRIIDLFRNANFLGTIIPVGASAEPELVCGDTSILGNEAIEKFLASHQSVSRI